MCKSFGANSVIRWGTWIRHPRNVIIQDNVFIGNNVAIGSETLDSLCCICSNVQINDDVIIDYTGGVVVGENTLISEGSQIYSHSHGLNPRSKPTPIKKTIEDNCWIGTRSIVLENCSLITSDSIIAAGAVVTKNISESGIYGGVPAKFIGKKCLSNTK